MEVTNSTSCVKGLKWMLISLLKSNIFSGSCDMNSCIPNTSFLLFYGPVRFAEKLWLKVLFADLV